MMKRTCMKLGLASIFFSGCVNIDNPLNNDEDGDGISAFEGDCDDTTKELGARTSDGDCDGVLTEDDCDDEDVGLLAQSEDGDCDGVLTEDDCDDGDAISTIKSKDGDCDGVLTEDDCDDEDVGLLAQSEDGDCDGVLTADDCDDSNPNTVNDMDCDGVLTADDCDDGDAISTIKSEDGDCDGVLTEDDCDDSNPNTVNDNDCVDYSAQGPLTYTTSSSVATVTDCSEGMSYSVYTPDVTTDVPVVILGHGFLRGGEKMFGWAEHFASWGIKTVVPTLCHYSITGVDHEMNGQNMVELAEFVGATSPIYAGQSAGGLAAVIAAAIDPTALGVVGLDATDTAGIPGVPDNIGLNYVMNVTAPAFALVGEPSTCNSNNNGVTMYQGITTSQIIRVTDSDHCDYESPTDWGCESFCLNETSTTSASDTEIRAIIKHFTTYAILVISNNTNLTPQWNYNQLLEYEENNFINIIKYQ